MFVQVGTTVRIQCRVSKSIEELIYIFWWKEDNNVLSYNSADIKVDTQQINLSTTISTLTLKNITTSMSGKYTCQPRNLPTTSVDLTVINGESS